MPENLDENLADAIAIIGIAGRFPGARNTDQFWRNIASGRDTVSHFGPAELEGAAQAEANSSTDYVAARSILEDVDLFDAGFFRMKPREAELTDPQQRLFLEICWEAFEDAGRCPSDNPLVGVFAGASLNTYFLRHVLQDRAAVEDFTSQFQIGRYGELLGALNDFASTRVSYKLGLTGPSMTVATACSTSLTAVTLACQSLQLYQCDMALAGGVSVTFPQRRGYVYADGGMGAKNGTCRPYDADAAGTVFGHGAGVVLLKRYHDAVRDGDHIYAVVLGYGVNNDGHGKAGFTAPSVDGQAAAMASAYAMAGIDPATITYVEGHGTATPLGDPIEIAALASVLGSGGESALPCHIGSVKGNVGHLDAAAGVTGLIKAALALHHRKIPPIAHFRAPNPRFELAGTRFVFDAELSDWTLDGAPRRAAVNALGVGGTNAHVVLQEAPADAASANAPAGAASTAQSLILPLSARTPRALAAAARNLADALAAPDAPPLADAAFTLQHGRERFDHRMAIAAGTHEEAAARLRAAADRLAAAGADKAAAKPRRIVFMFPGQGAQHPNMGRRLYETSTGFRGEVDRGIALAERLLGQDLRKHLFPQSTDGASADAIRSTILAQPALFIIEHALANELIRRGVKPAAMIGHSLGEFVAASLAGVMSYDDALTAIAGRAKLMASLPSGAMLAVRLRESEMRPLLGPDLDIAAINAENLCVASGTHEAIGRLEADLKRREVTCRRLHTSHAFHSAMMDPAVPALREVMQKASLSAPRVPIASSVTGEWLSGSEATSPGYWAGHCRATVRFAEALGTVGGDDALLIEVGPGATLTTLARQSPSGRSGAHVVQTLPAAEDDGIDQLLGHARAEIWSAGVETDCDPILPAGGRRTSLPTYPFERVRHFLDVATTAADMACSAVPSETDSGATPVLSSRPQAVASTDVIEPMPNSIPAPATTSGDHREEMARALIAIIAEVSGEDIGAAPQSATFLELGFDSLLLGQIAQRLNKTYKTSVTFRQLMGAYSSVDTLSGFLAEKVPPAPVSQPNRPPAAPAAVSPVTSPIASAATVQSASSLAATGSGLEALFRDQLAAMQQVIASQLAAISANPTAVAQTTAAAPAVSDADPKPVVAPPHVDQPDRFSTFIVQAKPEGDALSPRQQAFIGDLSRRLEAKMPGSKAYAQRYRKVLADPRAASAFDLRWKELVYPIVSDRAKGSRIWDIDGNDYVDVVNGFGQTAFGHNPPFIEEAVARQLRDGYPIGPQAHLAGEVCELICDMTGNERATFCNTGSEAVMAAMRVARAVTGRDKVVFFTGAYHGQFDEVLAKQGRRRTLPIAPGIPATSLDNIVILTYGADDSLDWIRQNAEDIAAVIVEPVQSRRPSFRPREFLAGLRAVTETSGTALVFDEVVTGFRVHPGGMQAVYGIRADMATYGKVAGGGLPVGILAGKSRFLDALDGGQWQFGDDSVPEVAPTFFAGTFVRHPLTLAATRAVLMHLRAGGSSELDSLGQRTAELAARMNRDLEHIGIKSRFEQFASWLYFTPAKETPLASLFFPHMRLLGVHAQEGFPWFMTTAHSAADFDLIADGVRTSVEALVDAQIMHSVGEKRSIVSPESAQPAAAAASRVPAEASLSAPMREVFLAAQLGPKVSTSFNEGLTLNLDGDLDIVALRSSLQEVTARHAALRASLAPTGELIRIASVGTAELPVVDVSASPNPDAELAQIIRDDQARPFDLSQAPLVRAQLVQLAARRHALVVCGHHIVFDGWSAAVMLAELAEIYNALKAHRSPDLQSPAALDRVLRPIAGSGSATEKYWLDRFATPPEPLELPSDRPRPDRKSFSGSTYYHHIDRSLHDRVRRFSKAHGVTPFSTLLAAVQGLLARLTGQSDICVAVPMAGQQLEDAQPLIGHLVNFLPVRVIIDRDATAVTLVHGVRDALFAAYDHQDYTLGTLVERLGLPRRWDRTPIADVQFNLESEIADPGFSGLTSSMRSNPKSAVNFDLFFNLVETSDGIRAEIDYATDLFDEATIARWAKHFTTLLASLTADNAQQSTLGSLDLLDRGEIAWLRDEVNATTAEFPADKCIHELIADRARLCPSASAVVHGDRTMSYAELDRFSSAIANDLISRLPATGSRIAVAVERSCEMVAIFLGIWKAGHAFVPLDPSHPVARLSQTMQVGAVAAVISQDSRILDAAPLGAERLDQSAFIGRVVAAADRPSDIAIARRTTPDNAAYVIFTSGSTGTPKGVEVGHRALVNFMTSMAREPGLADRDCLLAVTTVCFDISMLELFLPLVVGARVVVADRIEVVDGFALVDLMDRCGATVMQATPSLWRMVIEAGFVPRAGLRILVGGEPLPRDLADALLAGGGEVWNVYGPTETTIWSSIEAVSSDGPISIGHPIANTSLIVLEPSGRLAPIGVAGELLIGGTGLANGYFGRPDLTAAAYVTLSIEGAPPARYYRTGDIAMRLADGRLVHKGRRDQQIKLRGFRIELEEIETVLRSADGVALAAVGVTNDPAAGERLSAYLVLREGAEFSEAGLSRHARARLPDYMVPSVWHRLDALPMTANGKLDRKRLAAQALSAVGSAAGPLRTSRPSPDVAGLSDRLDWSEAERRLGDAWSKVLTDRRLGRTDDFFALGIDSIRVFQFVVELRRQGLAATAQQVFENPTISRLALALAPSLASASPGVGANALGSYKGGQRRMGRSR